MKERFFSITPLAAVALSALGFFLLFYLNELLFEWLDHAHGVNWIFLPSGLRLTLVLVFGAYGALGVTLGTAWVGLSEGQPLPETALAALASGLAPWIARWLSVRWLGLQEDLNNLNALLLLKMAVLFALLSAAMHQLVFLSLEVSHDFLANTSVMAVGDLVGTLMVLYVLKFVIGQRWIRP